jgi:succinate dehydrogenase / fumarate reductase membrane anchor subunit
MLLTVLIAIESNVKRLRLEDLANAGSTHPLVDVLCRREIKKVLCSDDEGSDKTALRDEVVSRRVREFGSARDGLREGRLQRLTAIAVIPLSLHFAASILSLATSGRKTAADWLSLPVLALVVILVVLAGIMHALIGVGSVVLDYVHTRTRSW